MKAASVFSDPDLQKSYQTIKKIYNTQIFTDQGGDWHIGPSQSLICMFVQKQWKNKKEIIDQLLKAFSATLQVPQKIQKSLEEKEVQILGMNYLSEENQLDMALIQSGFNRTSYQTKDQKYKGTSDQIIQQYYNKTLGSSKRNVSSIMDYLISAMKNFQTLAEKATDKKIISQILLTITARVIGDNCRIQVKAKKFAAKLNTSRQVVKVKCGSQKIIDITASYEVINYAQKYVNIQQKLQQKSVLSNDKTKTITKNRKSIRNK